MTNITLYQYAPGGCFRQLWDAAGGVGDPNQYDLGGPAEDLRQLLDPALEWNQYAVGGCAGQAEAIIEADEGGGWIFEADFQNGAYTLNGTSVPYTDIFTVAPPDWPNEPLIISPGVGLNPPVDGRQSPVLTSGVKATLLEGATFLLVMDFLGLDEFLTGLGLIVETVDFPNFVNETFGALTDLFIDIGSYDDSQHIEPPDPAFSVAQHKIAITITPLHAALCYDGNTPITVDLTPHANATDVAFRFHGNWVYRSIKASAALDDSELVALTTLD